MFYRNEIQAIFFSEFHHEAGPKIVYQVPNECISKEEFDSIHVYIITKPSLQGQVITINAFKHKIIGCPVIIDNPKYKRNAFIFNLSLVCDAELDTKPYEKIVRKLADYLKALEIRSEFLWREETRVRLPEILCQIHDELNKRGWCSIAVNESTTINLKVVRREVDDTPVSVRDCDVPMFVPAADGGPAVPADLLTSDLTSQLLVEHIDGFRHVGKIATDADMEASIVKATIQNLIHCGYVKLVSIFQYSNVYVTTRAISALADDVCMQQECVRYVARSGHEPTFRDVFVVYCACRVGTTVKDMCNRLWPRARGIDERKLMQYGQMRGIIRRLYKYPVRTSPLIDGISKRVQDVVRLCNGKHSTDEICYRLGISGQELDDIVDSDLHMTVCWK